MYASESRIERLELKPLDRRHMRRVARGARVSDKYECEAHEAPSAVVKCLY